MSTTKFRIVLAVVFALFVVAPVWGQTQVEDATGTVLDADKKPVAKAKVALKDKKGNVVAEVLTDASGNFSVKVPVGEDYTASVDAEGLTLGGIQVPVNTVKSAVRKLGELFLPPKKLTQALVVEAKGVVLGPDRKAVANAIVTIKAMASGQTTILSTGPSGEFRAQLPGDQQYEVSISAKGFSTAVFQTTKEVMPLLNTVLQSLPAPACGDCGAIAWWGCLLFAVMYSIFAMTARYQNILRVDRKLLNAELDYAERKAERPAAAGVKARVDKLLKGTADLLKAAEKQRLRGFLFGFRGEEIAAHISILSAQELLLETYTLDQIVSDLRMVVEELRPEFTNMAVKIEADLGALNGANPPGIEFLRCELGNALKCVNEKKQLAWHELMNWQNKAFALVVAGCGLLALAAGLLENQLLLFVGLLGGFASRLMRGKTMNSADGSLSWTTLFLSPLYGSFAGWAGVLLITVLTKFEILGAALNRFEWNQASCSNIAVGLAFLFGFSERFFSAVTDMAEAAVLKRKNASAADLTDAKQSAADPKAGILTAPIAAEPRVLEASFAASTLTLKGENLKSLSEVKLKPDTGSEITLVIQSQTEQLLIAKADPAPAAGSYQLLLGGKPVSGVKVTVP